MFVNMKFKNIAINFEITEYSLWGNIAKIRINTKVFTILSDIYNRTEQGGGSIAYTADKAG